MNITFPETNFGMHLSIVVHQLTAALNEARDSVGYQMLEVVGSSHVTH